jgi:hypothetical protein
MVVVSNRNAFRGEVCVFWGFWRAMLVDDDAICEFAWELEKHALGG